MRIAVQVIPGARETEVVGWLDARTVKIRLQAVPEKGKANEALVAFLGKRLRLAKTRIVIERGAMGRKKIVSLPDLAFEEVLARLGGLDR